MPQFVEKISLTYFPRAHDPGWFAGPLGWLLGVVLFALVHYGRPTVAADWPQILGPRRDGVAVGERLAENWSQEPPSVAWKQPVGEGHAGVAVADGHVVLFHRQQADVVVTTLDAESGRLFWEKRFPTHYRGSFISDSGPRAVPVISGQRIFLYGADAQLKCLSLASGKVHWSRDLRQEYHVPEGYFGATSTPLVEDQKLIVNVGGRPDAGLMAFDVRSGETLWQVTKEAASYSSPVARTLDGTRHIFFVTRLNVISLNPDNGDLRFQFPFGKRGPTVNAANPLVIGPHVFLSASYGVGAALVHIDGDQAQVLWRKSEVMSSQYMTSVLREGTLYGIDGREDVGHTELRAVDPLKGKIHWQVKNFGMATIILANQTLVIVKTNGELVLAEATRDRYHELARWRMFASTTRALPALAQGRLYARDTDTLKCIDLR